MQAEDVPAKAEAAGARLSTALLALDGVAAVRGAGLLLGVELVDADAKAVVARLLELGCVANAVTPTAVRLAPSLLITDDEIDHAVELIGKALQP
ncbi:MAG TPA: aminotransferase class III-fold pyridoxal phosphate-dependent enzyme, partial [Acidimicrobiales bacterium]